MSSLQDIRPGVQSVIANQATSRSAVTQYLLNDRVALITGSRRGIGLEMALSLAEAGATVYCVDLPTTPDPDWFKVQAHVKQLSDIGLEQLKGKGRLEYVSGDVTNQQQIWGIAEDIVRKEGRLDICFANAGVLGTAKCLEYPADDIRRVLDVNVSGVLFTAQAAGRQMEKLGTPGSIILTASISGTRTNNGQHWVAYNSSKSAVLQMGRSLACELGPKKIRVNTISPGYTYTQMNKEFLDTRPDLMKQWSEGSPLGRIGRPDEFRGVALFLASDASSFVTGTNIDVDGGTLAW